jgi:hypothetical protein
MKKPERLCETQRGWKYVKPISGDEGVFGRSLDGVIHVKRNP